MNSRLIALSAVSAGLSAVFLTLGAYFQVVDIFCIVLAAIPVIDITRRGKRIETILGEVVSPINPAPGCRFAPRCKYASEECHQPQELRDMGNGHFVACMKK